MEIMERSVRVWRHHTEMYFRYRLHVAGKGGYDEVARSADRCAAEIARLREVDAERAENAMALVSNVRSLIWVRACRRQTTPRGIIHPDRPADYLKPVRIGGRTV